MSTKEEIFNYVMHSPENTNASVLGSLLNGLEGGGTNLPEGTANQFLKVDPIGGEKWIAADFAPSDVVVQTGLNTAKVNTPKYTLTQAQSFDYLVFSGILMRRNGTRYAGVTSWNGTPKYVQFNLTSESNIDIVMITIPNIPDVTSSDKGKSLVVGNSGEWEVVDTKPVIIEGQFSGGDPLKIYVTSSQAGNSMDWLEGQYEAGKTIYIHAGDGQYTGSSYVVLSLNGIVPADGTSGKKLRFAGYFRTETGTNYYTCEVEDGISTPIGNGIPATRTVVADPV